MLNSRFKVWIFHTFDQIFKKIYSIKIVKLIFYSNSNRICNDYKFFHLYSKINTINLNYEIVQSVYGKLKLASFFWTKLAGNNHLLTK